MPNFIKKFKKYWMRENATVALSQLLPRRAPESKLSSELQSGPRSDNFIGVAPAASAQRCHGEPLKNRAKQWQLVHIPDELSLFGAFVQLKLPLFQLFCRFSILIWIFIFSFSDRTMSGAHYIVAGLARDSPLNLRWNSSELPDEQGPFLSVDWSE